MSPSPRRRKSTGPAPLTIREVAERAGVSTATVSRVLSGQMVVSEELSKRVHDAVEDLQYRPNRVSRRRRKLPTEMIGLVVSDLRRPLYAGMLRGVTEVVEKAGYTLLICDSGNDPQRELNHMNLMRVEGVAGVLLASAGINEEEMRQFQRSGPPVVSLDRPQAHPRADMVRVDSTAAARRVVEDLLAQGRRQFAVLETPQTDNAAPERLAGAVSALEAAGQALPEEARFHAPDDEAAAVVERLLALQPAPDALLVGSANAALQVCGALRERGIALPEQMAIVAFEPLPGALAALLPIGVMARPAEELGAAAARLLLERIDNPRMPARDQVLEAQYAPAQGK